MVKPQPKEAEHGRFHRFHPGRPNKKKRKEVPLMLLPEGHSRANFLARKAEPEVPFVCVGAHGKCCIG